MHANPGRQLLYWDPFKWIPIFGGITGEVAFWVLDRLALKMPNFKNRPDAGGLFSYPTTGGWVGTSAGASWQWTRGCT